MRLALHTTHLIPPQPRQTLPTLGPPSLLHFEYSLFCPAALQLNDLGVYSWWFSFFHVFDSLYDYVRCEPLAGST